MKAAILFAFAGALASLGPALGQTAHPMSDPAATAPATMVGAGHESAPVYYFLRTNRLDYGASQGGPRGSWDIDARVGTDEHRLMLKSEGDYIRNKNKNAEIQILYSTPISEFFDFQVGARRLFSPGGRNYFAIGVQGIAPYFFNTEATLFISDKGQPSARLKGDIDLAWTRRLYTRPSVELNAYGSDDRRVGTYAGLGTVKLAIQTRYEITRQFAPYVEIGWEKELGQTGAATRRAGERSENAYSVVGLRLLY